MSKELSAEWEEKIYQEAQQRPKGRSHGYGFGWSDGYEAGATKYASLLIEAHERIKDLENSMRNIIRAAGAADYLGAKRIAKEAFSPVNPKKKEDAGKDN